MQECNVIAKGSFSQFRFNEFISVRQYLLIREEGRKYLLLKLSNDAKETVTGLKLMIEQIDVRSACVEKTVVEWTDVNGEPGEKFIAKDKIPLRENCMEVKIHLIGATFGDYTYSVKSNELVVTYDKKQPENIEDYSSNTRGEKAVSRERKLKLPILTAILSMLVVILSCVFTFSHLSYYRETENTFRLNDVRYQFIGKDRGEGSPIRVVEHIGYKKDIVIPAEIEGYPVVEIEANAFRNKQKLQTIDIQANVRLESMAFSGCGNLQEVKLTGVSEVGSRAFENCGNLQTVTAGNLEKIEQYAFLNCGKLNALEISNEEKVLEIGIGSFEGCTSLKNITLDQAVSSFDEKMIFADSSSVETLYLRHYNSGMYEQNTSKTLSYMFNNYALQSLQTLTICDIDEIPNSFCQDMTALKSVDLGGIKETRISYRAFYNCGELSDLNFAFENEKQRFTEVGDEAFCGTKISKFDGSALERIGAYAFADNSELTDIRLSKNEALKDLGRAAFKNCTGLTTIHIPAQVKVLPESVFENCNSLTVVTFMDSGVLSEIQTAAMKDCSSMTYIKVPNSVRQIGDYAFQNCVSATTCMLSRNVLTIGDYAFANCENIQQVEVPKTTARIGNGAFSGCVKLSSMTLPFAGCTPTEQSYLAALFGGSSSNDFAYIPSTLREVTLVGDADIAPRAFYGAREIKRVYIKGESSSIGAQAFAGCANLREISLNYTLSTIEENAFENCYLLFEIWNYSDLAIERGQADMGGIAVYSLAVYGEDDERLDYVEYNGFSFLCAEEGWYVTDHVTEDTAWSMPAMFMSTAGEIIYDYVMVGHLFEQRLDVETLVMEGGINKIPEYAFTNCTNLTEVTASSADGIREIKQNAFNGCTNMKKVELPDGVTNIDSYAFSNCESLQSVNMPQELVTVQDYAFLNCKKITNLTFNENVQRIGYNALGGMESLQSLTVPFVGETVMENNYLGYVFGLGYKEGLSNDGAGLNITVLLPCDVGNYAFYDLKNLKSVYFKSKVGSIGECAFQSCTTLESVELTGGVRNIQNYAFAYSGLQNITLHFGLESIGDGAFSNTSLKEVTLPTSLSVMGVEAFANSAVENVSLRGVALAIIPRSTFEGCSNLNTVDMTDAQVYTIETYAFANSGLTNVSLPFGMSVIGERAFYNTSLKAVTLPTSVSSMGAEAFAYSALEKVEMSGVVMTAIPEYAFYYCEKLKTVDMEGSYIGSIGMSAFANSGLTYLNVPASVYSIEGSAFYNCEALESVNLNAANMGTISSYAFANCYALESVNLNTVNMGTISSYAFENCSALSDLIIGDGWKTIGSYAFQNCQKLTELHLPCTVEYIEYGAFSNCTELQCVWLPSSLLYIDYDAFYNCQKLQEVYNLSSLPITRGSWENGGVAAYALIVHTSSYAQRLTTAEVNGIVYKCAPTEKIACIYQYTQLSEDLVFDTLKVGGVTYEYYWVYAGAFSESSIKTLDTGVINEIGSRAFADCYNLRKVTLGESLQQDKVGGDAFYYCQSLWEVHNDSDCSISCGGSECGYVAYYALVIDQEIEYKQEGSFKFMKFDGRWYLYDYEGYTKTTLPDIRTEYSLFKHPSLSKYPFQNMNYGQYLIIPTYVTGANEGVFGWNGITVYYEGTQEQWNDTFYNIGGNYISVYYYNECVHNDYKYTMYWRYDSKNEPTTVDTTLTDDTTPATCQEEGITRYICETCGECITTEILDKIPHQWVDKEVAKPTCKTEGKIETVCSSCKEIHSTTILPKVAHDYSGQNGACIWCKQIRASEDCLGDLMVVKNADDVGFIINSDNAGKKNLYSDWRDDYGAFSSSLTIVAKANVALSFQLETIMKEDAVLEVLVDGKEYLVWTEASKEKIELKLEAGQTIEFRLIVKGEGTKEVRVKLNDVTVQELEAEKE